MFYKPGWMAATCIIVLQGYLALPAYAFPKASDNTCLHCHGNQAPSVEFSRDEKRPPLWANSYSMEWLMYEFKSDQAPPFREIPKPFTSVRGITHYDWSERKMTEIYRDHCIDI